jgi:ferrochelatase
MSSYDALLVLSFGGPEKHEDVIPFLENVLRGKNVPRERMLEVAEHYYHFDGRSPINAQNRALIEAVQSLLDTDGPPMPVYWGNRNWHPYLADTLRLIHQNGHRRVLTFVTSAFASYSGCRQYREDILRALEQTGLTGKLTIDKLPHFGDHPQFVEIMADHVRRAHAEVPGKVLFTAHSIPLSMANSSPYVDQLRASCTATAQAAGVGDWELVYQSRSGPPSQPWLEPDVCHRMRELHAAGATGVVVCPIGFLSDHMEVLYDLDTEAAQLAQELGLRFARAGTAAGDPRFAALVRDLIENSVPTPAAMRCFGECCPAPQRPPARPGA